RSLTPNPPTSSLPLHDPLPISRDGGVGAHVEASARELALAGHDVTVVAARIESPTRPPGVTLMSTPKLCRVGAWAIRSVRRRRRSEEHTSELQSRGHLVCRLLL